MQNKKVLLFSLVFLIAAFFMAANFYKNNEVAKVVEKTQNNNSLLQNKNSFVIGNKEAKVQLVEFFDPACETCALFHPYVKEILKKNNGKVKLVLRYAPFHNGSPEVVRMLEATKKQGKFIETLELLFASQKSWAINHSADLNKIWAILVNSKILDMNKLSDDMKDKELIKIVQQDLADINTLGETKTPAYFVNGKPLKQFGLQQLINLIDEEVKNKY